jgi:hypothetical protein
MRFLKTAPLLALLLVALAASPVAAGGWAVTTLDETHHSLQPGESYRVGYTIRQHGVTPFSEAKTSIRLRNEGGKQLVFWGDREGPAGHYVATVEVPEAGVWTWEVDQSPFAPQPLGEIRVVGTKAGPRAQFTLAPPPVVPGDGSISNPNIGVPPAEARAVAPPPLPAPAPTAGPALILALAVMLGTGAAAGFVALVLRQGARATAP